MGPIYLLWGKKKHRTERGKQIKQFYLRNDDRHLIWVKWTKTFTDLSEECVWSAEPQGKFQKKVLKKHFQKKVSKKVFKKGF